MGPFTWSHHHDPPPNPHWKQRGRWHEAVLMIHLLTLTESNGAVDKKPPQWPTLSQSLLNVHGHLLTRQQGSSSPCRGPPWGGRGGCRRWATGSHRTGRAAGSPPPRSSCQSPSPSSGPKGSRTSCDPRRWRDDPGRRGSSRDRTDQADPSCSARIIWAWRHAWATDHVRYVCLMRHAVWQRRERWVRGSGARRRKMMGTGFSDLCCLPMNVYPCCLHVCTHTHTLSLTLFLSLIHSISLFHDKHLHIMYINTKRPPPHHTHAHTPIVLHMQSPHTHTH